MQTRMESLRESLHNVAWAYLIGLAGQLIFFPLEGVEVEFTTNLRLSLYFTLIAITRNYLIRRWHNYRLVKRLQEQSHG